MTGDLSKYHRHWARWGNGIGTHAHLLDLVGFNKSVLEVGCNTGYLSRVMQQRGCQVTGVEIDEAAANLARSFCRRVIIGDAEKLDWDSALNGERFDVITFGDVLEHLRAPETVLKRLYHSLAPTGYVVVSLPNVAHASVRLSLLLGRFEYAPLGILDETHFHFYTRQTAVRLLESSGFQVKDVLAVNEPVSPDLIGEIQSHFPQGSVDWIHDLLSQEDSQAFQYVFRAVPVTGQSAPQRSSQADRLPAVSVVIVHRGDGAGLSSCLAVLAADHIPLQQVIVVSELKPSLDEDVSSVEWEWRARQSDEAGARLFNQVTLSTDADVVLILDSDFILQTGSVSALVGHFLADAMVGVIGSVILAADGRTLLQAGAYLAPPIAWITDRGSGHPVDEAQWNGAAEVDFVSPAAMAFRRSLWHTLGGFDENYSIHYSGADFCARAWAASYRVLVEPRARAISPRWVERKLDWLVGLHRDRLRFVRQRYGAGTWPAGFVEAEMALLNEVNSDLERKAIRLAYLWQLSAEKNRSDSDAESLLNLYEHAKTIDAARLSSVALPRLYTHQFTSPVPVLGGLIARLRALWGSIAARWYAESLADQQNSINQIVSDRVSGLIDEFAELEKLVVRLEPEYGRSADEAGSGSSADLA